jgi:GT2 family glycosyltransferase
VRCAAVVVNWNGGAHNVACVESLLAQGLDAAHVVFVDNASSDGSLADVRGRFPGIVTIANDRNEGYGHGANRGIRHALESGARTVFLVNNDLVLPAGTLDALLARFDARAELGIVGPRILHARDAATVWAAGGTWTRRQNLSTLRGHGKADGPEYRRRVDVDYVPGAAMLVRREVFERIGLLDGAYFAYHEDLDFCISARRAGFAIECDGTQHALHDAHASTGGGYSARRKYMMAVNTVWFLRRHGRLVDWACFALFDLVTLPALVAAGATNGRWRGALAKALGTWHGLLGRRVHASAIEPGAHRLW